jgi:phosphoenolpyruvate carboxykinase (ATP)
LLRAALTGQLADVPSAADPVFDVAVPAACPGVPAELLRPRDTWPDKSAYDKQARRLAELFQDNFKKFAAQASEAVRSAGPRA